MIKVNEELHKKNLRGYKLTDELADKIVYLYNNGHRKCQIKNELHISYTLINKAIAMRSEENEL